VTNRRFSGGRIWILFAALGLLCCQVETGAQADKDIERFATAYRAARTQIERRAVCLAAIDAGVVARDRSVVAIDAVFGTSYARKLPPAGGDLESGVVEFQPLPPPPSNAFAAAHLGWYLAFQFDSAGKVQNYYITNVHK
jgi:hypothetical protein